MLAIGNVIDTQEEYPGTVVASALWHMEPSIDHAIAQVAGGSFARAQAVLAGKMSRSISQTCSAASVGRGEEVADSPTFLSNLGAGSVTGGGRISIVLARKGKT